MIPVLLATALAATAAQGSPTPVEAAAAPAALDGADRPDPVGQDAAGQDVARGEGARRRDDLADARTAWRYFERNTDARTGLVSSTEGYPNTTAWDLGSSIVATVAARELGILDPGSFETRVGALLRTLEAMPLFDDALPNKAYDTRTAQMADYSNHPAPKGIGFSAVDVGRLVSALVLLGDLHPGWTPRIERVLARWKPCAAAEGGQLRGVGPDAKGKPQAYQEGRLGYEQYAATGLGLFGLDVSKARRWDRFTAEARILGVDVPHDARDRRRYGAVDAVVTEPWVLDQLEFGLDRISAPLAERIFEVQKRRYEQTGVVTAMSEDHLDRPPWFAYGAIWADGAAWRAVSAEGAVLPPAMRSLSTKAAYALAILHPDDPYAAVLRRAIEPLRDPERGWYAGRYENGEPNRSLNANTNGVILEAALWRRIGTLHGASASEFRARLASMGPRSVCAGAWARGGTLGISGPVGPSGAGPGGAGIPTLPRPAEGRPHVTGSLVADWRGPEGPGFGGIATAWLAPLLPYGFVRLGAEATPQSRGGDVRMLWGFGYDDWHDGTFSATVHNWGPVYPQDGPNVRGAELNVGYKVPRLCSAWLCGQLYPFVTVPFEGGPYVGGRLTLTFFDSWFVMGGLGWTIPSVFVPKAGPAPATRMFYGFGRWTWKPGSLFITYYDWGPDWRAHNGILSVGVNWQF